MKKNFTYNLIYQILIMIIPLITMPYVSRILGVEGIGVYSYTHSISHYFVLFSLLGINNYGNRTIAQVRDNKSELSSTFSNLYFIQFLNSIFIVAFYIIFIFTVSPQYRKYFLVQIIYVFSAVIDINWFFFGLEEFKVTVTRNSLIRIISTILIFIFVNDKNDLIIYFVIMAVSSFLSQLVLWLFVKERVNFVKPNFKEALKHFKPILMLFVPVLAISLYRMMDKIMIGALYSINETGLYENASRITSVPMTLITALGTVMLPRISNLIANNKVKESKKYIRNSMQYAMSLSIPIMFGLMGIADRFVTLYLGSDFIGSAILIKGLSPILVISSWASIIRTQYLIPNGKDKIYISSVLLGAIFNLIINFLLVGKYGAIGAVIGTIIAEFIVMFYQSRSVREALELKIYLKDSIPFIISGGIMFLIVEYLNRLLDTSIISLVIQIFIGFVSYLFITYHIYKYYNYERLNYLIEILGLNDKWHTLRSYFTQQ